MKIPVANSQEEQINDNCYILQTCHAKYIKTLETEQNRKDGTLSQVVAARREHVAWRFLSHEEMMAMIVNQTPETSCNIEFSDSQEEEEKRPSNLNSMIIENTEPELPVFGRMKSEFRKKS